MKGLLRWAGMLALYVAGMVFSSSSIQYLVFSRLVALSCAWRSEWDQLSGSIGGFDGSVIEFIPNFLEQQGFVNRGGDACASSFHWLFELCVWFHGRRGFGVRTVDSGEQGRAFVVFADPEQFIAGWFGTSRANDLVNNYELRPRSC